MNKNELDERLVALRPADADIDRLWPIVTRTAVLDRVLAGESGTEVRPLRFRPRGRRARLVLAGVGAAAALAVGLPLVLPHGAPGGATAAAARELDRLVDIAANAPYDEARPGQFLHIIESDRQEGNFDMDHPDYHDVLTVDRESWMADDGTLWRVDTSTDKTGTTSETLLLAGGKDWLNYPSPAYLATLPTEPDALEHYLRENISGSTSDDEAVFVAIGDMLRGGFAPRALRMAAIEVLKETPKVDLGAATTDAIGRPVVEFTFVDEGTRPGEVQFLRFSTQSAEVVEEGSRWPGASFLSTVTRMNVVDGVPARVRETATDCRSVCGDNL